MTGSSFIGDVRYAVRALLRHPGFSLVAVLTFAIGIGANTAVFSVFNGVLLKPLPYPDPDRITMIWMDNRRQGIKEDITSYPTFRDWRDQSTSYAHMAAFSPTAFNLTGADEPERLIGAQVTAKFFDVMGVKPLAGRLFGEGEETPGQDAVVIISHGLWHRRFGGATDVLGKTITLNGRAHEIVGVMPPELAVPDEAELWKPLAPPEQARTARGAFWLPVIGRLKPGISVEEAQAEMSGIASRLEDAYPVNRGFGVYVVPLHRQMVGNIDRSLQILLAAVGLVLLIACANLANLLLGRTASRGKEFAIRTALGARRVRLVRQIVTEALVLAVAGGALGLALAFLAVRLLVRAGGGTIPRPEAISIDGPVLTFTLVLAVIAAILAALLPAFQASRRVVADDLREGGREGGPTTSRRMRSVLVGAEVAVAFVLLAGAGLLVRTLWSMQQVDRGFQTDRVATMRVSVPASLYASPSEVRGFFSQLLERVRALPGVESAATGTAILQPLVTNSGVYSIEGRPVPPPEERVEYPVEIVSPGFFETLGITLRSGRTFSEQDHADAPRAVIVNETLARLGWPGQDPIGRRMRAGDENSTAPWMTVVGVIRDVKRADVLRTVRPELYMCALQVTPRTQMVFVRTAGDPDAIISQVRKEVRSLNPQLPLFAAGTLSSSISETLASPRFRAVLLAAFAMIALVLASIGIYGVTAYAVNQRTHEVGIRMALGAGARSVLGLVMRQHLQPVLAGVGVGVAGGLALNRVLRGMLYGVGPTDPTTFVLMGTVLLIVAAAACWLPARRATRVDPLVALRSE